MSSDNKRKLRKYYYVARKQTFEEVAGGLVRVTDAEGRWGLFEWGGKYLEGELTQASAHMLVWCGGPMQSDEFRYYWIETPIDVTRKSGWPEEYEALVLRSKPTN